MSDGAEKRSRDPFSDRYERSESEETDESAESTETAETSETSKTSETTETTKMSEASGTTETAEAESEGGGATVRERKNVNMYLPDELVRDLQATHAELNVAWQREHGEDLPKNHVYYPAVIKHGLDVSALKDELDLSESTGDDE